MEHLLTRPEPGKWASAVFSVLMHALLIGALFWGVQWQRRAPEPVSVELVRALPPAPPPQAEPVPEVKPLPPKPVEVKPPEPKPIAKPDIALKEPEKKKPVKKEDPKPEQSKPVKKPEPQLAQPKLTPLEQMLQKEADKLAAAKTQNRLDQEATNLRAKLDAAAIQASRGKAEADWVARIKQKVKSNFIRPPGVTGDPKTIVSLQLLPSGEILGEPRIPSTGNPGLDEAIRRAILKSSPLPKPEKNEVFQREINITFYPMRDEM